MVSSHDLDDSGDQQEEEIPRPLFPSNNSAREAVVS